MNKFFCSDGVPHEWERVGIDCTAIDGIRIIYQCLKCEKCKRENAEFVEDD